MDAEILHQSSASASVNVSEAARGKFCPGADLPLEEVSEAQYWRNKPMSMDKPAAIIEGVSIRQSDNHCCHSYLGKVI